MLLHNNIEALKGKVRYMRFFVTEDERKSSGSTAFIEFQKGKWDGECWHINSICMDEDVFRENLYKYGNRTESILKNAVRNDFLEECPNGSYMLGVNTPHVVFNYLDYLLWKEDEERGNKKYSDFIF